MVTMYFLQVRLLVALFGLFLALPIASKPQCLGVICLNSVGDSRPMFVTCKLPYPVGNKNTHIDNLHGTWPNERETAVHGCHGRGDMAAHMQMILPGRGLVSERVACWWHK